MHKTVHAGYPENLCFYKRMVCRVLPKHCLGVHPSHSNVTTALRNKKVGAWPLVVLFLYFQCPSMGCCTVKQINALCLACSFSFFRLTSDRSLDKKCVWSRAPWKRIWSFLSLWMDELLLRYPAWPHSSSEMVPPKGAFFRLPEVICEAPRKVEGMENVAVSCQHGGGVSRDLVPSIEDESLIASTLFCWTVLH